MSPLEVLYSSVGTGTCTSTGVFESGNLLMASAFPWLEVGQNAIVYSYEDSINAHRWILADA